MIARAHARRAGVLLVFAATVTCTPSHLADSSIPTTLCQPRCERMHECDGTTDVRSCVDRCVSSLGPRTVYERADLTMAARACTERQACLPHMDAAIASCIRDAFERLQPTPAAQAYCQRFMEKNQTCSGRPSIDMAHCLYYDKSYTDPVIAQLDHCVRDSPCKWLGRCFQTVVGEDPILDDPDRTRAMVDRPLGSPLRDEVRVAGTVTTDGALTPIAGATVCILPGAAGCATTDSRGIYQLSAPAHAEISITVRAADFGARVVPITTIGRDVMEFSIPLHDGARAAKRYAAWNAQLPNESVGALLATAIGQTENHLPEGATFRLDPASGQGPLYFSERGEAAPDRTTASSRSTALFADLKPGEAVLTIRAPGLVCAPWWGGWPSSAPESIRVPIVAGFETRVTMRCR
jgi:hypothetical protein